MIFCSAKNELVGGWTNLFQPIWKILVKLGIFPKIGMKIETIWSFTTQMKIRIPLRGFLGLGTYSFFGMIKSIHELWGPHYNSHYGGFFPHSFGVWKPWGGRNHLLPAFACQNRPARGHWKPPSRPCNGLPTMGWRLSLFCHFLFWWNSWNISSCIFFSVEWTLMGFGEEWRNSMDFWLIWFLYSDHLGSCSFNPWHFWTIVGFDLRVQVTALAETSKVCAHDLRICARGL